MIRLNNFTRKLKTGKSNVVFLSYFLPYSIIVLAIMIIVYLLFFYTTSVMMNDTIKNCEAMLQIGISNIDNKLRGLEEDSRSISAIPYNLYMYNGEINQDTYFSMRKYVNTINYDFYDDNFVAETFIYFYPSNILIASQHVSTRPETIYGNFVEISKLDFEAFRALYLNFNSISNKKYTFLQQTELKKNNKKYNVIPYVEHIPFKSIGVPKGIIISFIDINKLFSLIFSYNVKPMTQYIFDRTGKVVASRGTDYINVDELQASIKESSGNIILKNNGGKYSIIFNTSEQTNWRYVTIIPTEILFKNSMEIKTFLLALILALTIFSFISIVIIAWKRGRSLLVLDSLVNETFSATKHHTPNILKMAKAINGLLDVKLSLSETVLKQEEIIIRNFYYNLLNSKFFSLDEINLAMRKAGIRIPKGEYIVTVLRIIQHSSASVHEYNPIKISNRCAIDIILSVRSFIMECAGQRFLYCDADNLGDIYLLMHFNDKDDTQVYKETSRIIHAIYDKLISNTFTLQIGVGTPVYSYLDISRSYKYAVSALNYSCIYTEQTICFYKNISFQKTHYFFPLELEIELINLSITGQTEKVKEVIDFIYFQNIEICIQIDEKQALIMELKGTLLRAIGEIKTISYENLKNEIDQQIINIHENASFQDGIEIIKQLFVKLAGFVVSLKNSERQKFGEAVIDFVERNYCNPNLCLSFIASHFNKSEKHISWLFKDYASDTFTNYVEQMRLRHAVNLLKEDVDITVERVSEMVGYTSVNTFYKAFKRRYGIIPTAFRT
jgi:two-component system response regulator YesN